MALVTTSLGPVAGRSEGTVEVYRGIPYAAPITGVTRFSAPSSPQPWHEPLFANSFGPAPPQHPALAESLQTGENCLTLNIWTPSIAGEPRPVLVYIPGGGFLMCNGGDPGYDGTVLASRGDVIVVTVNYRVGALGFLYLDGIVNERVPWSPNAGLLDQIAALTWIQENIASFGGDPGNVTIFGESAGAMSVVDLMVMPDARGLFHRVISESGAGDDVASVNEAVELTEMLLFSLDLPKEAAHQLVEMPLDRLLVAQQHCHNTYLARRWGLGLRPVVDGSVLPDYPRALVGAGAAASLPLLVGTNLDEWRLFADAGDFALDEAALRDHLAQSLGKEADAVLHGYRELRPHASPSELWFAIESDQMFRIPAIWLAEAQSRHQKQTFLYLFTWPSPIEHLGSCHGIDLPFVFGTFSVPHLAERAGDSPSALSLAATVQDAWIAFARHGDPNAASLPTWPSYRTPSRATLIFDADCTVRKDPFGGERGLWEERSIRLKSDSRKVFDGA